MLINENAASIEQKVFKLEEIKIVIRVPPNKAYENGFNYQRRAKNDMLIPTWIKTRLRPIIGEDEVDIIDGHGNIVTNSKIDLATVQHSYT